MTTESFGLEQRIETESIAKTFHDLGMSDYSAMETFKRHHF